MLSAIRLLEQTPLKRLGFYYQNSYLSEVLPDVRASTKFLGPFLRDIGSRRKVITAYMKEFLVGSEFAAIDLCEIFTYSEGVNAAMLGHNTKVNTYHKSIWYYTRKRGKEQIITFLDEKLKAEETSTLIYAINQLQKKDETAENTKKTTC